MHAVIHAVSRSTLLGRQLAGVQVFGARHKEKQEIVAGNFRMKERQSAGGIQATQFEQRGRIAVGPRQKIKPVQDEESGARIVLQTAQIAILDGKLAAKIRRHLASLRIHPDRAGINPIGKRTYKYGLIRADGPSKIVNDRADFRGVLR